MPRRRWSDQHPHATEEPAPAPARAAPDLAAVLALQGSAGNQAVARLLARKPGEKRKREADAEPEPEKKKARKSVGRPNDYRSRNAERERLAALAGKKIVGAPRYKKSDDDLMMQSEHAYGHKALIGDTLKRGQKGDSREVENKAAAYYEDHDWHRAHVGTGSGTVTTEAEGGGTASYSADQYREDQRGLLLGQLSYQQGGYQGANPGNTSAAMQLNQAEYASLPGFRYRDPGDAEATPRAPTATEQMADDSYEQLIVDHPQQPVFDGDRIMTLDALTDDDKVEMAAARDIAHGLGEGPGGWPSAEQIAAWREQYWQ